MNKTDLAALLESSGAVLHGHFLLSSGRHSEVYFEKFRILEQPNVLSALCAEIADEFRSSGIDIVAGPTTGGIIIAFEVARLLGTKAVYIENENGVKTLRRGASIPDGANVLVVDDVLTTGLSVRETITAVENGGGNVAACAVLIDRAPTALDFGCPLFSAYKVESVSYAPEEVPAWLSQIPLVKPGTRKA